MDTNRHEWNFEKLVGTIRQVHNDLSRNRCERLNYGSLRTTTHDTLPLTLLFTSLQLYPEHLKGLAMVRHLARFELIGAVTNGS